MIIEREIEICTTERMIHKWNLFTYSRDIENNPRLEVFLTILKTMLQSCLSSHIFFPKKYAINEDMICEQPK